MADRRVILIVAALLLVLAIVVFFVTLGDYLFQPMLVQWRRPGNDQLVPQVRAGMVPGVARLGAAPTSGAADRRITPMSEQEERERFMLLVEQDLNRVRHYLHSIVILLIYGGLIIIGLLLAITLKLFLG
jgi:hypothetical protein